MNAPRRGRWEEGLEAAARRLDKRFARSQGRQRVRAYLRGLLSPTERNNGLAVGRGGRVAAPRTASSTCPDARRGAPMPCGTILLGFVKENLADPQGTRVVVVCMAYVQARKRRAEVEELHPEESGRPFLIPGFDLPPDAPDPEFRGARVFSYRREDILDTPEAHEVLNRFLARDRLLVETLAKVEKGENITAHYVYDRRGDQNLRLIELHELLGNWKPFPLFSYEDTW